MSTEKCHNSPEVIQSIVDWKINIRTFYVFEAIQFVEAFVFKGRRRGVSLLFINFRKNNLDN